MELKQSAHAYGQRIVVCFNRTFMELKPVTILPLTSLLVSFNRTFMELKQGNQCDNHRVHHVLIGPSWN